MPLLVYTRAGWDIEKETYADELLHGFDDLLISGQRPFDMTYLNKTPQIHPSAYVAPNATICGDVIIGAGCRILFGACIVAEDETAVKAASRTTMPSRKPCASAGSTASPTPCETKRPRD